MISLDNFVNFKNVKIYQDDCCFKYNLDSILLADFVVKHYKRGNIIDLATGNIPIPLFINYRLNQKVIGVELQSEVYDLGIKTIQYNSLENTIKLIQDDIKNLKKRFLQNSFEVVICNPPYFSIKQGSKIADCRQKSFARHEVSLTIEDVIHISKYLLNNKGSLFLIYRTERITELLTLLRQNNMEPKIIRMIHARKEENAKLFLIEARLNAKQGCIIEKPLIVYKNKREYTKEIITMFGDEIYDTKKL